MSSEHYGGPLIQALGYFEAIRKRPGLFLNWQLSAPQQLAEVVVGALWQFMHADMNAEHAIITIHDARTVNLRVLGEVTSTLTPSDLPRLYERSRQDSASSATLLALSHHVHITTHRDGLAYHYTYRDGERQPPHDPVGTPSHVRGVEATARIGSEFFEGASLDFSLIEESIALRSHFLPGTTLTCHDTRTSAHTAFHADAGPADLLAALTSHHDTLGSKPIHVVCEFADDTIDVHMCWIAHASPICRACIHPGDPCDAHYSSESSPSLKPLIDELSAIRVGEKTETRSIALVLDVHIGSPHLLYSGYIDYSLGQGHIDAIKEAITSSPEFILFYDRTASPHSK